MNFIFDYYFMHGFLYCHLFDIWVQFKYDILASLSATHIDPPGKTLLLSGTI